MWYFAKPLRELRSRSISNIGEITSGAYVRISGTVNDDKQVIAPLTRSPCSFFEVEIREWDNGATYPFAKQQHGSFRVTDYSGAAWIACDDTTVQLAVNQKGHSSDAEVCREIAQYVRSDLGRTMTDAWGIRRSLDWRERLLAPGDHVCVVGIAEHQAHPDGQPSSYRDSPSRLVVRADLIVERRSCRCS